MFQLYVELVALVVFITKFWFKFRSSDDRSRDLAYEQNMEDFLASRKLSHL